MSRRALGGDDETPMYNGLATPQYDARYIYLLVMMHIAVVGSEFNLSAHSFFGCQLCLTETIFVLSM
jgi:hypothetical protein